MMDDINLNGTSNGGNSSSDDEVVVGEDEELTESNTFANGSSGSKTNPFNNFYGNSPVNGGDSVPKNNMAGTSGDGFFRFETSDNDDLFGERPIPEWVAWGERSDFQVGGGSSANPFVDQNDTSDSPATLTDTSTAQISSTSIGGSLPNGTSHSTDSSDDSTKCDTSQKCIAFPSLFEEDVEFVGVEPEGTEQAMEQALKEGVVGEAGPLKTNLSPKTPEKGDTQDDEAGMKEFNDANYWRIDQEVAVLEYGVSNF